MGRSVDLTSLLDIDDLGRFEVLRFSDDRFGADPAFPDESHGLSEAGVGILMYRIQKAKRMVFSAPTGESALRLRSKPESQLFARAFFSVATSVDGKPDHFLASLVYQNVLIEWSRIGIPVQGVIPAISVMAIMADNVLISYSKKIGVPHEM
jgi:hypothetical protein